MGRAVKFGTKICLTVLAAASVAAFVPIASAGEVDRRALDRIARPPLGLPAVPFPKQNPPTAAKIALGRKLFFDRRLSLDGKIACATCHLPTEGFTGNGWTTPPAFGGGRLRRNSPTIFNAAYMVSLFHDGRDPALEIQVIGPLTAKREMANPSVGYLVAKVDGLADYRPGFQAAFGGRPSIGRIGDAIASYERSLLSANSPFDRWRFGGEAEALTAAQKRGFALFTGKGDCSFCHRIDLRFALLTDNRFHNTGAGYIAAADQGRFEVTGKPEDRRRFKTPSLRNIALTAPYMHDGLQKNLREVVEFYNQGGRPNPGLDPLIRPLGLGADEIADLIAFLEALTGDNVAELITDARSVVRAQ